MKNYNGILLPIFSLPSNYGIGDFGEEAYNFIDTLSANKIDIWQILPIYPIGYGNSPYSPKSFFAIEPLFVSLEKLKKEGLIKSHINKIAPNDRIDYKKVRFLKYGYFKEAYDNFDKESIEFQEFKENVETLNYALFTVNYSFEKKDWNYWVKNTLKMNECVNFEMFIQFIALKQWQELRSYANKKGIKILGDLPIYPDYNSSDVYFHRELFQLKDNKTEFVSGAAPDCFSKEGQKWGHPLYDVKKMEIDNYKYQNEKYKYAEKLFDYIRIDHFKAYESFFKIPFDKTPKDGEYEKGMSYDFFDQIFKKMNKDKFIVEDLGDLNEETYKLRDFYNFKGMKIFEYTFNPYTMQDEYNGKNDVVSYTGNHDNNTIVGWVNSLSNKAEVLKHFKATESNIHIKIIEKLIEGNETIKIFPIQDLLGMKENSRINLPGFDISENWSWKLMHINQLKKASKIFGNLLWKK